MKKILFILFFSMSFMGFGQNNDNNNLSEKLKPFEGFIGKMFKGEFGHSTPENPVIDVQYWERILNGNAIKITHSVNDGIFGGESIIMWDFELKSLVSWYFTTEGFYTQSTILINEDKVTFYEKVTGNKDGITETRGIYQLLPNGDLKTETQYFQNGAWIKGHEIYYKETLDLKVIFK